MFALKLCFLLYFMRMALCDWISEWLSPIQQQLNPYPSRRTNEDDKFFDEDSRMVQVTGDTDKITPLESKVLFRANNNEDFSTARIKTKLEMTLQNAEALLDTLKVQINAVAASENMLKEAIANGRAGISTVTVSTMGKLPRTYIIRDGFWSLCNGMVQYPVSGKSMSLYTEMFSAPRCIGQEISSVPDPCVFNSVIKYETIPRIRTLEYKEDDYLCLKAVFNSTLEQYLSVPLRVVNDTCKGGVVRSIMDNIRECGVRVMSEYTFYPHKSSAAAVLPLEYCMEPDGACKLIVAWHVSNSTVENFEFLKNEESFKKYFVKLGPYLEQVI